MNIVDQKTFLGTVESCAIDEDQVAVLCFICEKIRDNKTAKEVKMVYDRIPMAIIVSPQQSANYVDFVTLRAGDKVSLVVKKWDNKNVTYEAKNLTLRQKYQDPVAYVGGRVDPRLDDDPHSENERLVPAVFPS